MKHGELFSQEEQNELKQLKIEEKGHCVFKEVFFIN